jgi:signal transduction histidine kinase
VSDGSRIYAHNATKGFVTQEDSFPRLVSLACHDLRTPLATVFGFARTLLRTSQLDETTAKYVAMIESASEQMSELLEELGLAARIEAGRYAPTPAEADTAALATAAADRLGHERVSVSGDGGLVSVDLNATERAFSALVQCALRHGGLDQVEVVAAGARLAVSPVTKASAPVVLGRDLRDLGAAVAVRVIEAQGGTLTLDGDTLEVRLPVNGH